MKKTRGVEMERKRNINIALVPGDGAAPEAMAIAEQVVLVAARMCGWQINFRLAPMGYDAFQEFGNTAPQSSIDLIKKLGLVFFGGVGNPALDKTIGTEHPEMRPEAPVLLALRQHLGLLINLRPFVLDNKFAHLFGVRADRVPEAGVRMLFARYLLEDCYFGTADLIKHIPENVRKHLGIKLKNNVTGDEEQVTGLSYFTRANLEKYFRWVYSYAREMELPVIVAHKQNVDPVQVFYLKNAHRIGWEFPDVKQSDLLIDAGIAALFHPGRLNAVIACANLHGDLITDGAAEVEGGMGMMHSLALNPDTGEAMFESGAGTAPSLAGLDQINPLGRILTGALMLDHIGCQEGGEKVRQAVKKTLNDGYRTPDIYLPGKDIWDKVVGTARMGELVIARL